MPATETTPKRSDSRRVFLGLGANVGQPEERLLEALDSLHRRFGPIDISPLYRTRPVPVSDQPDFLNAVAAITTAMPLPSLLAWLQGLEREAGRQPDHVTGAPRPLDLDILLAGNEIVDRPGLCVPHPRLRGRRFVLAPLVDLAPDLTVPPDARAARELLLELGDGQRVERIAWSRPPAGS